MIWSGVGTGSRIGTSWLMGLECSLGIRMNMNWLMKCIYEWMIKLPLPLMPHVVQSQPLEVLGTSSLLGHGIDPVPRSREIRLSPIS